MRTIILFLFTIAFTMLAKAQSKSVTEQEVPATVKAEFSKAHPSAFEVNWKQLNTEYIVEYSHTKTTSYAVYTNEGKLVESRDKITTFAMPSPAYDYIKEKYSSVPLKEYFRITDATGLITYGAKVKNEEVIFDKKGVYVKTIEFVL